MVLASYSGRFRFEWAGGLSFSLKAPLLGEMLHYQPYLVSPNGEGYFGPWELVWDRPEKSLRSSPTLSES